MAVDRYSGPVEPGMVFTAPDNDGKLGYRRVKVIARTIDSDILIIEEMPSRIRYVQSGQISKCPETNLRIVFVPEEDEHA